MAQKGSKRPSPNHHKAICPKRSAPWRKVYTQFEERNDQRRGKSSGNAAKENTKTKAEKNPSNHCKPFFLSPLFFL